MTKLSVSYCIILSILFVLSVSLASQAKDDQDKQVYIVYMGSLPTQVDYTPMSHHMSILQEVTKDSFVAKRIVRNYKKSFNGFAAWLTESEREMLESMEGVVSVFPNKQFKTQTTRSWDFMGLEEATSRVRNLSLESDMVIGVIDTGIWPESDSFSDQGFSPPPKKWKGVCEGGKNFVCNNKLIGARHYVTGNASASARDNAGHGTHTASTAAGNAVKGVSFYGLGYGTARGGVPASRIAAYKVCGHGGCTAESILSAFDDAIADKVDVITISLGSECCTPFKDDPIAIGAFHAMANGILTVNSAGNSGPDPRTVSSIAPWIFTVAASNTNRAFVSKVVLGDGKTVVGRSVNTFDLKGRKYALVYGKSASRTCNATFAGYCYPGCLDRKLVKGKIVMCDFAGGYQESELKGAIATIVKSNEVDLSFIFSFPVSVLSQDDYKTVLSYFKSTKNPKATVLKSEAIFNQIAPVVVSFSSRGPNTIVPDILKPDITAPGVEIVAAFCPEIPPSFEESDKRHVKYSVLSGTSMSCPHVAGVAAYVKSFHPNWSPSMIQSAIMTTAWPMKDFSSSGFAMSEFAYGAGHVNPVNAIHPGLVYEANKYDHISFLCGLNYTVKNIQLISGKKNIHCFDKSSIMALPRNLNYPTLTAKVLATKPFKVSFYRTVTNVGLPNSTYKPKVVSTSSGSKLYVEVVPEVLSLKLMYEKKSFEVTVSGEAPGKNEVVSVDIIWSDGVHSLRSPIVIYGGK